MNGLMRELGRLIRGALPFAIVNNGTDKDGGPRPISHFARLLSYAEVQDAIDAGHKLIFSLRGAIRTFHVQYK